MGITPTTSKWDMFQTRTGMIAVINSIIGGVFAGVLSRFLFSLPVYAVFGIGIVLFVLSLFIHRHYIVKKFDDLERRLEALFPSVSK